MGSSPLGWSCGCAALVLIVLAAGIMAGDVATGGAYFADLAWPLVIVLALAYAAITAASTQDREPGHYSGRVRAGGAGLAVVVVLALLATCGGGP